VQCENERKILEETLRNKDTEIKRLEQDMQEALKINESSAQIDETSLLGIDGVSGNGEILRLNKEMCKLRREREVAKKQVTYLR
jgi:arginine deiminase